MARDKDPGRFWGNHVGLACAFSLPLWGTERILPQQGKSVFLSREAS